MDVMWLCQKCLFPAHAGVILFKALAVTDHYAVPRTRGGDPIPSKSFSSLDFCSPHTRG